MGRKGKKKGGRVVVSGNNNTHSGGNNHNRKTGKQEDFPKLDVNVVDAQFRKINKECDLYVPTFIVLDNIVINKHVFKKSDMETLNEYYQSLDKDDVDKELMSTKDFNFYLDHVHSILDNVLNTNFMEFNRNMIYNNSLKDFVKTFLYSVQKQGFDHDSIADQEDTEVNKQKFTEIIKIILLLFWRLLSNNVQIKGNEDDGSHFSESYLGDLIFKAYDIKDFVKLIYIYGRSNDSVITFMLKRLSELNESMFESQFRDMIVSGLKKIKNHAKSMSVITKSHFDKSGLTPTEDWPDRIKNCLEDSIEQMKELFALGKYFPNCICKTVWSTDILIILSNYYYLIKEYKVDVWEEYIYEKRWLDEKSLAAKKIIFKTIIMYLKKHYFGVIGSEGAGYVEKQKSLGSKLTDYILQMSGNQVIHKDSVPSNCSIIEKNEGAHSFLKKISKVVEFEPYLFQIEDSAIPNRELCLSILSSAYPHEERGNPELELAKKLSQKEASGSTQTYTSLNPIMMGQAASMQSTTSMRQKILDLENTADQESDNDGESLMIKRDIDEEVKQEKASLVLPPEDSVPQQTQATIPPVKNEVMEDIAPEFLVQSEQDRIKKKEKKKKFKDLWKNHKKVLKQMDDEEKKKMDKAKKNALRLAQEYEYEDEYDDVVLEKQVSVPANDITAELSDDDNGGDPMWKKTKEYRPVAKSDKDFVQKSANDKVMKQVPKNFKSYKASVAKKNENTDNNENEKCWVDDEVKEEPVKKQEDSPSKSQNKPASQLPQSQSKKNQQKGKSKGKGRKQETTEEGRAGKDKKKADRNKQTRKKGGHHNQKQKANKKYGV